MSEDEVRNYRLELLSKSIGKKGKEKEPVRNPREEEEQSERMGLDEPSPTATLAPPLQELTLGPSSTAGQEAPAKLPSRVSQGSDSRSASKLAPAAASPTIISPAAAASLRRPAVAGPSFFVEVSSRPKVPPISARANLEEAHPKFRLYTDLDSPSERPRMSRDDEESKIALLEDRMRELEDWANGVAGPPKFRPHTELDPPSERPRMKRDDEVRKIVLLEDRMRELEDRVSRWG
jgi:hypothetical protein